MDVSTSYVLYLQILHFYFVGQLADLNSKMDDKESGIWSKYTVQLQFIYGHFMGIMVNWEGIPLVGFDIE